MKIHAFDSSDWAEAARNGLSKEAVVKAVESGATQASELLPTLSEYVNIVVRPNDRGIITEYGTGGYANDSESIEIVFDKDAKVGADIILHSLQMTPFHELNHAARYNHVAFDPLFKHSIIFEGLATVFEREYGKYQPLYGIYDDETEATLLRWLKEIEAADWNQRDDLMFKKPDGTRWMGYKTGTWLVDRAIKNSGKSVIELTLEPASEIITLAAV